MVHLFLAISTRRHGDHGGYTEKFETLVNRLVQDEALKNSINELLRLKKAGNELDRGPKIPELSDFIESEFSRLKTEMPEQIGPKPDVEKLNQVFRFSLATVW